MRFKLKHAATAYDIPLASIRMKEVRASNIIQTVDFSHQLAGNPIAAHLYVNTHPDSDNIIEAEQYKLVSDNIYGPILCTDEYYYDTQFGTMIPLWFMHPLRQVYYNPNIIDRTIRKTINTELISSDRIVTSLLPSTGSHVIVADSVRVSIRETNGGSLVSIPHSNFYVNYTMGSVTLAEKALYTLSGEPIYEFIIHYQLATIDIRIHNARGIPYRFELLPISHTNATYFTANILSSTTDQLSVIYRSQKGPGTVMEVQEKTTAIPVYTEVSDETRVLMISDPENDYITRRVYSRSFHNGVDCIYTTCNNPDHVFSFRPYYIQANKIMVKEPIVGDYSLDWHMGITAGHVINNTGEYTVKSNSGNIIHVREHARIITNRTIAVSGNSILVQMRNDGTWNGITVTRKIDKSIIAVETVDNKNGIIGLTQEISRKDEIIVSYSIRSNNIILHDICFNPLTHHAHHNEQCKNSVVVICMISDRFVPPGRKHPFYYLYLDKHTGGRQATYTYSLIDNWINSTMQSKRNTYRETMNLPDIFLGSDLIRIEPLALVHVANPYDPDTYQIEDIRVCGGGYPEKHYSFYDYSHYDGEGTDLESMLAIEIPEWMYDDLVKRALLWDADVIQSDAPEQIARYKVMESIRTKTKKFRLLGTTEEVTIGRKTLENNS